jgi:hypothetical protein
MYLTETGDGPSRFTDPIEPMTMTLANMRQNGVSA